MLSSSQLGFSYNAGTQFLFPAISCQPTETLLITGSSGKGKTTLLHLLAGILKPDTGNILIGETDLTKLNARKLDKFRGKRIGIIFQQPHFVASLSVIDNLLLAPFFSGTAIKKDRANELLYHLDISEQVDKKPSKLSQGQQQRVSIARALMNNPAIVLADEPTSSLDDDNCIKVAALLQQQAKISNAALVIVTHDQRLKQIFHQTVNLL